MYYVLKENLHPGMILATPAVSQSGEIILSGNQILKKDSIAILKNKNVRGILARERLHKNEKPVDLFLYESQQMLHTLYENKEIKALLDRLKSHDEVTYTHSVFVAIYAYVIGKTLHIKDVKSLTIAALFHDIGKLYVPVSILRKTEPLTTKDWDIIHDHPVNGEKLLREKDFVNERILKGIRSHHENEDGSGYPDKLSRAKIHPYAKIIHVADVYEALISKRAYKNPLNPADAILYMKQYTDTYFDKESLVAGLSMARPYADGMKVILSNDTEATVTHQTSDPLSPIVQMDERTVNLNEEKSIYITQRVS